MTLSDSDASWKKGSVVNGRYEIRGSKRGGMGEVYFAFDRELYRMVAIKTPLPAALETAHQRDRFFREAEAWIALGIHPNVCSAYYVQEIGGFPRLFIEYVEGGSLSDWLKEKKEAPFQEKLDISIQTALGMQYTHTFSWKDEAGAGQKGLVHRDLKPANILMGEDDTAKITDFGLVGRGTGYEEPEPTNDSPPGTEKRMPRQKHEKPESPEGIWKTMTIDGAAIGTPAYMPPEQWTSTHHTNTPVDIYAFGCVLYELFCGRPPFRFPKKYRDAMHAYQLYLWEKMHRELKPPIPAKLNPELDAELSEWILRCLEKDPAKRPESFEVLKDALKSIYVRITKNAYVKPEPRLFDLVADSLNNQGASYITIGQSRRAEAAWQEALKSDPHHIETTFNVALYEWRHKGISDEEVHRRMEELLATPTDKGQDDKFIGKIYLVLGQYTQAAARLRKAAEKEKPDVDTLKDLGLALCAEATAFSSDALWKEVERCFEAVVGRGYMDPYVATGYALALNKQGLGDRAEYFFQQAVNQLGKMPGSVEEAVHRLLPGNEISTSVRNVGKINALTFSADGNRVIWGNDRHFGIWGVRKNDIISKSEFSDPQAQATTIAICPFGEIAVAGGINEPLRLWNIYTGQLIDRFEPRTNKIVKTCISPDGSTALSGNPNGLILAWDIKTRKRRQILSGHTRRITALAIDPDGKRALSASEDLTMRLWEIETGECCQTYEGHTGRINSAVFSPDGKYILSGADDRTLRLWDTEENQCRHIFEGHSDRVTAVTFSPDGQYFLSGSADKTVRVWNFRHQQIEHLIRFENLIHTLAVSPDARLLALVSGNALLILGFNIQDRYRAPYALTVPVTASIASEREIEFRERLEATQKYLDAEDYPSALTAIQAARAVEGYIRAPEALKLWAVLASRFPGGGLRAAWEIKTIQGHERGVNDIALISDGRYALTAGQDRTLRLWNLETGESEQTFEGHTDPVTSVAVAPQGKYAVSASSDHTLRLWDIDRGICVHEFMGHAKQVYSVDISPDERFAISGSEDGQVRIWDLDYKNCIHIFSEHSQAVSAVCFGPDGRLAASGSWDNTLRLWDLEKGRCSNVFKGHTAYITAISFSPNGLHIITGSDDRSLRCWDMKSGVCIGTLSGHRASVTDVVVSPDGRYALSGSHDRTLRLWKLESGECIRKFEGHTHKITSVDFWPDGQSIISASEGKIIRLWHLDWEPHVLPQDDWDESARPYLNRFLTLHTPYTDGSVIRKGKPSWNLRAFQDLMEELRHSGFGWLSFHGVKKELEKMTRAWTGPPSIPKPGLRRLSKEQWPPILRNWMQKPAVWMAIVFSVLILMYGISHINQPAEETKTSVQETLYEEAKKEVEAKTVEVSEEEIDEAFKETEEEDAYDDERVRVPPNVYDYQIQQRIWESQQQQQIQEMIRQQQMYQMQQQLRNQQIYNYQRQQQYRK